jgi:hypothetical protein
VFCEPTVLVPGLAKMLRIGPPLWPRVVLIHFYWFGVNLRAMEVTNNRLRGPAYGNSGAVISTQGSEACPQRAKLLYW